MKRIICTLLVYLLFFTFVSCNASNENRNIESDVPPPENSEGIYTDTIRAYTKIIADCMKDPRAYSTVISPPGMEASNGSALLSLYYNYGSPCDGYCIKDINGDGVDELIFLGANYYVQGLCTYVDGKVRFIKEFGHNGNGGAIDKYGNIYDSRCGRYLTWFESIQVLDSNGELETLLYYGNASTDDLYVTELFIKNNGEYTPATTEEIDDCRKQYHQYGTPGVGDSWINMTREHLSFTPFYSADEINEISVSVFETVFSGDRAVISDLSYETFGYCMGSHRNVWQSENQVAYIDFDGDGLIEALVRSKENGDFVLNYYFPFNTVYANLLSAENDYTYFVNGEFCKGSSSDTEWYRISAFTANKYILEPIDYAKSPASQEEPIWIDIEIPGPAEEK